MGHYGVWSLLTLFFSIHAQEIFSLIVSSFENLDDISSPSYEKRISILQSVNEVNAWAVMVGLRCNYLLLDMFQIFLKDYKVLI